ncbi:MAG: hypothetical protein ACLRL0_05870 [Christensenellaceae bacterium]
MKKFILSAVLPLLYLICACLSPAVHVKVRAEDNGYACIRSENVYLYSEENDKSGLFILPCTYYVKVLSSGVKYSYVEYLSDGPNTRKINGYCKNSELTFVDYVPVRPYLYYTLDVTYYIEDASPSIKDDDFLSTITITCAYYGEYRVGSKLYCYVLREGTFGYIPKPADLSYELNDEYDNHTPDESDAPAGNFGDHETMPPAQIAILVLLCILVPVIAALILRPPKKPPYESEE